MKSISPLDRLLPRLALLLVVCTTTSCALLPDWSGRAISNGVDYPNKVDGLVVGFVVNQTGARQLKPYLRQRYADQIASEILYQNTGLEGRIDSFRYLRKQMGESFDGFLEQYRTHGTLTQHQRGLLIESQLRRRYLMLVSISPLDEKIQLPPVIKPLAAVHDGRIPDYQVVSYQTARIKKVNVEIYDTRTGRLLRSETVSSADGGRAVVSERTGRRYIGNSMLGAVSNALANKFRYGDGQVDYPAPPTVSYTLSYIWKLIARDMPAKVLS